MHHIRVTVSCGKCQQDQVVKVLARNGFSQMTDQVIPCVKCGHEFTVLVPDQIVGGPFFPVL